MNVQFTLVQLYLAQGCYILNYNVVLSGYYLYLVCSCLLYPSFGFIYNSFDGLTDNTHGYRPCSYMVANLLFFYIHANQPIRPYFNAKILLNSAHDNEAR